MALDRIETLTALVDQGVVPVFYHPDPAVCVQVIQACANGGAKCVEFTNRGDFAAEVFLEVAQHFSKVDSSVILGAGSVIDGPTAALYLANGAKFMVSPILSLEVGRICNRRMIPYMPGCGTVTEISDAHELGCDIVKLFPGGSVGGPEFVKAVLGPLPWTKAMPTGGVEPNEASLRPWFEAGIVACGMGSGLITKQLLAAGDYAGLEARVRETVQLIKKIKAG